MIFGGIRLPDEIRIAHEEKRLVVFAGAGISVPVPSGLPLFNELVKQIGDGSNVEAGQEDRVLGELHRRGTDVQAAVAQRLYHQNTKPTPLHRAILRLFKTPDDVRIVTTNFDNHFTSASKSVFKRQSIREFYAPALPQGDAFHGLVYLHGSARYDHRQLVLTDEDFGAAYITRGWASDFLIRLFSTFTVLFVGYSHGDITTTYLAKGLQRSGIKTRYAMICSAADSKEREHWKRLGIHCIEYPIDAAHPVNSHISLTNAVGEWASHSRESLLQQAKRIKKIAKGLPPEGDAASEYICYCLTHPRLSEDFVSHLRHPSWVGWLEERHFLKAFFENADERTVAYPPYLTTIAYWLCSYVRQRYPELLLRLIHSNGQRLSKPLCSRLARSLWHEHDKTPDPRFAQWLAILTSQGKDSLSNIDWFYLLRGCCLRQHPGVGLRLLEFITSPEICFDVPSSHSSDPGGSRAIRSDVRYSIRWPFNDHHHFDEIWNKVFKPHFALVADSLERLASNQLLMAHFLLRDASGSDKYLGRFSHSRSSIAPHEQNYDRHEPCLSYLIEILRHAIELWGKADVVKARQIAAFWWKTGFPLFQRLAVYAVSVDGQYSDDERIRWLLEHKLVFEAFAKKEVFDILKSSYHNASAKVRSKLMRLMTPEYHSRELRGLSPELLAYEQFNILTWLSRDETKCGLVTTQLKSNRRKYPKFTERKHPEFEVWHYPVRFVDPKEGVDFDQVLSQPAEQYASRISSSTSYEWYPQFEELFRRDKEWGANVTLAIANQRNVESELWNAIFVAWGKVTSSEAEWEALFALIDLLPLRADIYSGIARLVSDVYENSELRDREKFFERISVLMDESWKLCSQDTAPPSDAYQDWLTSAINHVGGWIGQHWVQRCVRLRNQLGSEWHGIPDKVKLMMLEAIQGASAVKTHARIVVTPYMGHFFEWDRDFTTQHLLPLLDWDRDAVVAQQSWSVLLNYSRGRHRGLESLMLPYYRQYASMIGDPSRVSDQLDEHARWNFGLCLAAIAMGVIDDPVESRYFRDFLPQLDDRTREALTVGIDEYLKEINDDERRDVWNRWLNKYIETRKMGIPLSLSNQETVHMVEWCLHLGPAFPDAVDSMSNLTATGINTYGIICAISEGTLLTQFPSHCCRLATIALRGSDHGIVDDQVKRLYREMKALIPETRELQEFEVAAYQCGVRLES